MLDETDGDPINQEHHVSTVSLTRGWFDLPFPRDVEYIGFGRLEVDEPDSSVSLLNLVVPRALTANPREKFSVSLNRWRNGVERLDNRASALLPQPGVELRDLRLEQATYKAR